MGVRYYCDCCGEKQAVADIKFVQVNDIDEAGFIIGRSMNFKKYICSNCLKHGFIGADDSES